MARESANSPARRVLSGSRLDRFNKWLQLFGNLGVLLGLLLVVLQLRQNVATTRAQTRAMVMQSVLSLIQMERDPPLVDAYMRQRNRQDLTSVDSFYLDNMANATLRVWENTFFQHHQGLFDESEFQADLVVWGEMMKEPQYVAHWRENRQTYSAAFRSIIDGFVGAH